MILLHTASRRCTCIQLFDVQSSGVSGDTVFISICTSFAVLGFVMLKLDGTLHKARMLLGLDQIANPLCGV